MDGVKASREQIERVEAEAVKKREAAERKRALEKARTSKEMAFDDGALTTWRYVVVDDKVVRIVGCDSSAETIVVPGQIDGYPVYEIGPDGCARIESAREIICHDSIEQIGACAFRMCEKLNKLVLPENVSYFKDSWLQESPNVEELVLPGMLDKLSMQVVGDTALKRLHVGKNVRVIEPGVFRNSKLDDIEIDPGNPFIKTDGAGVYTFDGSVLLALAKPLERYEVLSGCTSLGRKAFDGRAEMREVVLPEGLERIEAFAFTHAGIRSIEVPPSVSVIEEKAFYYCREMASVKLNEGLKSIGDSAFEESGLKALHIPASIEHIGNSITMRTPVKYRGPECSLEIDAASKSLFIDNGGGLYRREDDGIHLVQLMDRETREYTTIDDVAVIDEHAFSHHYSIREVRIAEGAREIRENAFRDCGELESVELPDTIEAIGANAFLDTALARFRMPRSCTKLGVHALVTRGAHRGAEVPTLRSIEVADGNEAFYTSCGMLCRRGEAGDWVVAFSSSEPRVVFPESVVGVEEYAFNNAQGIEYLSLNKRLKTIRSSGLTTWCWIEHIHVELQEPVEGRTTFDFRFPDTPKSMHGISIGIGGASWVNVPGIMAQYDICVINSHDYNTPRNPDNIPVYEQVKKVIERLRDPVLLLEVNKNMYERLLRNNLLEICVDVARHDDRRVIDELCDMGYLNARNIEDAIVEVGALQDAAMTGYLLELKRRRFGREAFDFDL